MRDPSLLDEITRLRKLQLDTSLSSLVEEAAQLLGRERRIEAEALRSRTLRRGFARPNLRSTLCNVRAIVRSEVDARMLGAAEPPVPGSAPS